LAAHFLSLSLAVPLWLAIYWQISEGEREKYWQKKSADDRMNSYFLSLLIEN
jgi:hypothetical protein